MNLSCLSGLSCANMFPGNLQNNLDLNSFGGSWWCAHQEAIHLSSVPSSCWHCIICWFCSEIPSTLTTNLLLLSTDTEMLSYSSPLDLLAMYASVLLKNHFPSLKVLFTKSPNHRVYLHMIWWDIARNQTLVVYHSFQKWPQILQIWDGHAGIFADAHGCGYSHYPTYVGYSAILSDNADICIRMAIPITNASLSCFQQALLPRPPHCAE